MMHVADSAERMEESMTLDLAIKRLAVECGKPADIEAVRVAVTDRIRRKLGSPKCDLWTFLREQCGYTDNQIRDHLWDGMPKEDRRDFQLKTPTLINIFSYLIVMALVRHENQRCDCASRYVALNPDKAVRMRDPCEKNHWIKSYGRKTDDRRRRQHPPDKWLRIAVDGDSNLHLRVGGQFRRFGNSMLCAVLTTPADNTGLYLIDKTRNGQKTWLLVETRPFEEEDRLEWFADDSADRRPTRVELAEDTSSARTVRGFKCGHCRHVVGQDGASCCKTKCVWTEIRILKSEAVEFYDALVSMCPNKHFWPLGKNACPTCGEPRCGRERVRAAYGKESPRA